MTAPAAQAPAAKALDIVVVSWNTVDLSRVCVASVFANRGDLPLSLWFVDNASSDGSADMVENEFSEVHLIRNAENRGFAAANNQALRQGTARYALLLNSDAEILSDVLARSVDYLDAHPDVGVFGCRVLNPDRTLQPTCFRYPSLLNAFLKTTGLHRLPWPSFFGREHMRDWQRDSERDVDVVTGCYLMVRRSALEEVGYLDEDFFFNYEETDWCQRFRDAGWRVRFAPVGEIIHVGNASGRQISHEREIHLIEGKIRLHRKHGGAFAAGAIWLMAAAFWVLRGAGFGLLAAISGSDSARQRAALARAVLRAFPSPSAGGVR